MSRELAQMWNSWNTNQGPCGMFAQEVEAFRATLQWLPFLAILIFFKIYYLQSSVRRREREIYGNPSGSHTYFTGAQTLVLSSSVFPVIWEGGRTGSTTGKASTSVCMGSRHDRWWFNPLYYDPNPQKILYCRLVLYITGIQQYSWSVLVEAKKHMSSPRHCHISLERQNFLWLRTRALGN